MSLGTPHAIWTVQETPKLERRTNFACRPTEVDINNAWETIRISKFQPKRI
jgi:hypothetical protein